MKKFLKIIVVCFAITAFVGCSKNDSSNTDATQATNETFLYENQDLGFSTQIPGIVENKVVFYSDSRDENGETITNVYGVYPGEKNDINIVIFEEMSSDYYTKLPSIQEPVPVKLGESSNGRVVAYYPLTVNSYEEGTTDYDIVQQFINESSVIVDNFQFLN